MMNDVLDAGEVKASIRGHLNHLVTLPCLRNHHHYRHHFQPPSPPPPPPPPLPSPPHYHYQLKKQIIIKISLSPPPPPLPDSTVWSFPFTSMSHTPTTNPPAPSRPTVFLSPKVFHKIKTPWSHPCGSTPNPK